MPAAATAGLAREAPEPAKVDSPRPVTAAEILAAARNEAQAAGLRRLQPVLDGIEIERLEGDTAHVRVIANVDSIVEREKESIERLLSNAAGRRITLVLTGVAEIETRRDEPAGPSPLEHPLVQEASRLFEAKVVSVTRKRR